MFNIIMDPCKGKDDPACCLNVFGTAELQTVVIRNKEYLLGFLDDNGEHTISLIDVKDKKIESIDFNFYVRYI